MKNKLLKSLSLGGISFFILSFALPTQAALLPFCAYTGHCQMCDFIRLAVIIATWGLGAIGSVALLFFVIGGIYLVGGGHKPDTLTKGKTIISQSIVGMIIVLSAWLIINFVMSAFAGDGFYKDAWYKPPMCEFGIVSITEKTNECYILYECEQRGADRCSDYESAKTDFETSDCAKEIIKVNPGAPCTGDGVTNNGVIYYFEDALNLKVKCVSKCEFLALNSSAFEDYKCLPKSSCDIGKTEEDLCPTDKESCCIAGNNK